MFTILHASDLQYGRPYRPEAGEALQALARGLEPDLVVVAGDLTQRAKAREYRGVRKLLDGLGKAPLVVTPGNHDVPLYRFWERLFAPYRKWRRYIGAELDSVHRVPGATVVALNSSAPRRAIVGGRVDPHQVAFARKAFAGTSPGELRLVVLHHHLVPTPSGEGGRPLPNAAELARAFEEMAVDAVLGGHVHHSMVTSSRDLIGGRGPKPGVPFLASGTATSSRGRPPEVGENTLHVIHVDDTHLQVEVRRFHPEEGSFRPEARHAVLRGSVSGVPSAGEGSGEGGTS
ncbi:MAG: metallophosphoesterase family protein [Gemmatimonadota bacterium]